MVKTNLRVGVVNLKVFIDPVVGRLSNKEIQDIGEIVEKKLAREKLLVLDVEASRGRLRRVI